MTSRVRGTRSLLSVATAITLSIGMLLLGRTAYAGGPPAPVPLLTAATFAVLAGTPDVTNTGPTVVTGNLGIHPGAAVSGFTGAPNGTVIGTIYAADPGGVALQAKSDLTAAYLDAEGRIPLPPVACDLGGLTLVAGVYNPDDCTLGLTGTLTLDAQNDPNAVWIFQAPSDLVTASASSVVFINGGSPCNVFWQVDSSATLGSSSSFVGTIMALTSITIANGVTLNGRALARNGTVTMDNDAIGGSTCPGPGTLPNAAYGPERVPVAPWSLFLVLSGVALVFGSFVVTLRRLQARARI
jgi:hypothetical protein